MQLDLVPAEEALRPVEVSEVAVDDAFWSPRQHRLRTTTLNAQYAQLVDSGRIGALRLDWVPGSDEPKPHPFWESDVAKWLEAASFALATHPDQALEEKVDSVIDALAAAQQPDGYLNVYFTVVEPGARFTDLHDAHELYCAGHLIEAGVTHSQATGKTTLLAVVRRYADLLCDEFGPGGAHEGGYDGHEEIELALVRLFRATGAQRYLRLALAFIDARGTRPLYFDVERERRGGSPGFAAPDFPHRDDHPQEFREYNQTHLPVREQTEVVGHAVRAMYLYTGMADLALETGSAELRAACERLWHHLTSRRMYVTAGIGDSRRNEGFTRDYALPNETAYNETCAAIGLVLWASRMTTLTGDAGYFDVLERALYNGVLAGVSADGQRFFYENPLASDGSVRRHEWFECACCPPNLARLEASLGAYVYSAAPGRLAVNLYVASRLRRTVQNVDVELDLRVAGPAAGTAELTVTASATATWELLLRVPEWARRPQVFVNGQQATSSTDHGYLRINRQWSDGDRVSLSFEVPVRRLYANPLVTDNIGRAAIARGPFIYCAEGIDLDVPAQNIILTDSPLQPGNEVVPTLTGTAMAEQWKHTDRLYDVAHPVPEPTDVRLVPYFSWNNRGRSTMQVWLREG